MIKTFGFISLVHSTTDRQAAFGRTGTYRNYFTPVTPVGQILLVKKFGDCPTKGQILEYLKCSIQPA